MTSATVECRQNSVTTSILPASSGQPKFIAKPGARRVFSPESYSGSALCAVLHGLAADAGNPTTLGASLVNLDDASLTWHHWAINDRDAVQRLAVNCALKDLIWMMGLRWASRTNTVVPAIDVEVAFHVRSAGTTKLQMIDELWRNECEPTNLVGCLMANNAIALLLASPECNHAEDHITEVCESLTERNATLLLLELRMHHLVRVVG